MRVIYGELFPKYSAKNMAASIPGRFNTLAPPMERLRRAAGGISRGQVSARPKFFHLRLFLKLFASQVQIDLEFIGGCNIRSVDYVK
jgi:hypothetical protein